MKSLPLGKIHNYHSPKLCYWINIDVKKQRDGSPASLFLVAENKTKIKRLGYGC